MEVKVLGSGCSKCNELEKNTKEALNQLDIKAEVEKVTDMKDIMSYGVMKTPALVVDGKVQVMGKVPKVKELLKILG